MRRAETLLPTLVLTLLAWSGAAEPVSAQEPPSVWFLHSPDAGRGDVQFSVGGTAARAPRGPREILLGWSWNDLGPVDRFPGARPSRFRPASFLDGSPRPWRGEAMNLGVPRLGIGPGRELLMLGEDEPSTERAIRWSEFLDTIEAAYRHASPELTSTERHGPFEIGHLGACTVISTPVESDEPGWSPVALPVQGGGRQTIEVQRYLRLLDGPDDCGGRTLELSLVPTSRAESTGHLLVWSELDLQPLDFIDLEPTPRTPSARTLAWDPPISREEINLAAWPAANAAGVDLCDAPFMKSLCLRDLRLREQLATADPSASPEIAAALVDGCRAFFDRLPSLPSPHPCHDREVWRSAAGPYRIGYTGDLRLGPGLLSRVSDSGEVQWLWSGPSQTRAIHFPLAGGTVVELGMPATPLPTVTAASVRERYPAPSSEPRAASYVAPRLARDTPSAILGPPTVDSPPSRREPASVSQTSTRPAPAATNAVSGNQERQEPISSTEPVRQEPAAETSARSRGDRPTGHRTSRQERAADPPTPRRRTEPVNGPAATSTTPEPTVGPGSVPARPDGAEVTEMQSGETPAAASPPAARPPVDWLEPALGAMALGAIPDHLLLPLALAALALTAAVALLLRGQRASARSRREALFASCVVEQPAAEVLLEEESMGERLLAGASNPPPNIYLLPPVPDPEPAEPGLAELPELERSEEPIDVDVLEPPELLDAEETPSPAPVLLLKPPALTAPESEGPWSRLSSHWHGLEAREQSRLSQSLTALEQLGEWISCLLPVLEDVEHGRGELPELERLPEPAREEWRAASGVLRELADVDRVAFHRLRTVLTDPTRVSANGRQSPEAEYLEAAGLIDPRDGLSASLRRHLLEPASGRLQATVRALQYLIEAFPIEQLEKTERKAYLSKIRERLQNAGLSTKFHRLIADLAAGLGLTYREARYYKRRVDESNADFLDGAVESVDLSQLIGYPAGTDGRVVVRLEELFLFEPGGDRVSGRARIDSGS